MEDNATFLSKLFGGPAFKEQRDIDALRSCSDPNAYCCNEAGELMGICATEITAEAVDFPPMPHLEYLNVGNNQDLKSWTFTSPLPALMHFDASDSGLKEELSIPAGFNSLVWLDAARNEITDLVTTGRLEALEHLDMSGNQLRQFSTSMLQKMPALERLYLNKNPLPSSKMAAAEKDGCCLGLMKSFQRDIEKEGATEDKEFKVILVGNGGVGKSCLVERLVYDTFQKRHLSTNGVVLEQYPREPSDFPYLLNLWDFAGQDIYHATHRLFMQANAIYLALWDEATLREAQSIISENGREEAYENFPLDYWLHYIRHQAGDNSPIIVVQTKSEKKSYYPGEDDLSQKYKPQAFLHIDSAKKAPDNNIEDVLYQIEKAIGKLSPDPELPQNWAQVRQALRDNKQHDGFKAINYNTYLKLAEEHGLDNPEETLAWLVRSGVVFYREGYFGNALMLNQGWAIDAIYAIFRRDNGEFHRLRDTQKGHLSGADLQKIWGKSRSEQQKDAYQEAEQELLLQFMIGCELCFEVTPKPEEYRHIPFADRQFIAPQLLPKEKPSLVKQLERDKNMLHVRYQHDFLHQGIIQRFIVRAQTLAKKEDIWLYGITLEENNSFAVVQSKRAEKRGKHAYDVNLICHRDNLDFMDKIRNTLEEIQGEAVEEWVSLNGQNWVNMAELAKREGKWENIPDENGDPVPLSDLQVFRERRKKEKLSPPPNNNQEETEELIEEVNLGGTLTKILMLMANPRKTVRLNLEREHARIHKELSGHHDHFKLLPKYDVRITELNEAIVMEKPSIVHFSGHGRSSKPVAADPNDPFSEPQPGEMGGLLLVNPQGDGLFMALASALAFMFKSMVETQGIPLKVVLLNACHSGEQAEAIAKHIPFVIGTSDKVLDEAAWTFSKGFYFSLADNAGQIIDEAAVRKAFNMGQMNALFMGEPADRFVLYVNGRRV